MGVKFAARVRRARRRLHHLAGKKEDDACASAPTRSSSRSDADEMQKHAGSFDFILDTVSAEHDINAYLDLLAPRRQR